MNVRFSEHHAQARGFDKKSGVHAAMGLEESSAPSFVDSTEKLLYSDAFKSGASAEEQASVEPSGARSARA